MSAILTVQFFIVLLYLLIQFARLEQVQEIYNDTVIEVEGRLDWARSRTTFPFGMRAQLDVASQLLNQAHRLWRRNKWHQAYRVALKSQEAMTKAQKIYILAIKGTQKKTDDETNKRDQSE